MNFTILIFFAAGEFFFHHFWKMFVFGANGSSQLKLPIHIVLPTELKNWFIVYNLYLQS